MLTIYTVFYRQQEANATVAVQPSCCAGHADVDPELLSQLLAGPFLVYAAMPR